MTQWAATKAKAGTKNTPAAEQTNYDADYYRALFAKKRTNDAPIRMALVGKENTTKTGLAISLARQAIGPDQSIIIIDLDNSAAQTVACNYADDPNIVVIPVFDESDGSIFKDDNTTDWVALVDKTAWFVRIIGEHCREGGVGAVIFDGGSTFLKWCEFAMTHVLLHRSTNPINVDEGDRFNQAEWRTRNKLFRDVINRFHQLPVTAVFFTFHLKDIKEFMDIGSGQKGLMKVGERPEWENGTKRLFSQQLWLTRYSKKGDVAAGVKADKSLGDNEWVVRCRIEEMKGWHQELLGTSHDVLRVKDGKVTWNGLPNLTWGKAITTKEVATDEGEATDDGESGSEEKPPA